MVILVLDNFVFIIDFKINQNTLIKNCSIFISTNKFYFVYKIVFEKVFIKYYIYLNLNCIPNILFFIIV